MDGWLEKFHHLAVIYERRQTEIMAIDGWLMFNGNS